MASPLTVYAGAGDGYVRTATTGVTVWADARDATTGAAADYTVENEGGAARARLYNTVNYYVARMFFPFDIAGAGCPADATITAATFKCVRGGAAIQTVFFQGTQAATDTLAVTDVHAFTGSELTDRITMASGWNTYTFNATGLTYLNSVKTGWAKLCMRETVHDVDDSAPDGDYAAGAYFSEHATYDPYLTLTYTEAASGRPPIFQPSYYPSLGGLRYG